MAPAPAAAAPAEPAVAPAEAAAPAAPAASVEPSAAAATAAPAAAAEATTLTPPVRIKAGSTSPYTDSSGNVWLADQGFDGGGLAERSSDLEIANTKDPAIYRTERYGMNSFSCKIPNGKYVVKLHFAETYEGITGAGQRVFSYTVAGQEFKDVDVLVKAGGPRIPYIQTVNVDVTEGKLDITFKSGVDNPEINAIEILPAS